MYILTMSIICVLVCVLSVPEQTEAYHPSWSPDGQLIAYDSPNETDTDIWVMRPDGSDKRVLIGGPSSDSHPAWSPDGRWIAFESNRHDGTGFDIWIARSDGSEPRRITSAPENEFVASWSPDSQRITFSRSYGSNTDVFVVDIDDPASILRITDHPAADYTSRFAPDGEHIAFDSRRNGSTLTYIVPIDDVVDVRPLWSGEINPTVTTWSHRTGMVATSSTHENPAGDLYVLNLESQVVELVTTSEGWDGAASFSPDATQLVYQSRRTGMWRIRVHNLADGSDTRIAP